MSGTARPRWAPTVVGRRSALPAGGLPAGQGLEEGDVVGGGGELDRLFADARAFVREPGLPGDQPLAERAAAGRRPGARGGADDAEGEDKGEDDGEGETMH